MVPAVMLLELLQMVPLPAVVLLVVHPGGLLAVAQHQLILAAALIFSQITRR
jgi:hypothetical protein